MKQALFLSLIIKLLLAAQFVHAGQNRLPEDYVDDIWHCDNPWQVDRNSISCDDNTFHWEVSELEYDKPPRVCGNDFDIDREEIDDVPDWMEPCVLWALTYGDLSPSGVPSAVPSAVPSEPPTVSPFSQPTILKTASPSKSTKPPQPVQTTPPSSTAGVVTDVAITLDPIVLTLVWPTSLDDAFSVDFGELRSLTEIHVLEALQAELGVSVVKETNLILRMGVPGETSLKETVSGVVVLSDEDTSPSAIQTLFQQAFEDDALDLYLLRLKIAKDPTLKQVQKVTVRATGSSGQPNSGGGSDGQDESLDTVMIVVIAIVGGCLAAVCLAAYCLFCRQDKSANLLTVPRVIGNSKMGIPGLPTMPTSNSEDTRDEENPSPTNTAADDGDELDNQSLGTSLYSYTNDDTSMISVAHSFLYSITETSRDDSIGESKKREKSSGQPRSVEDTLQSHFGSESTQKGSQNRNHNKSRGILGPSGWDSESTASASLVYEDDTSMNASSDRRTEPPMTTPTKQRFEDLWRQDEAGQAMLQCTPADTRNTSIDDDLQATIKKSNVAGNRIKAYDEQQDGSDNTRIKEEPGPSPRGTILSSHKSKSAPPVEAMGSSVRCQDELELSRELEEEDRVSLPLPMQLNTSMNQLDSDSVHSRNSQSSHNSNRSDRSGGRNRVAAKTGKNDLVHSVRHLKSSGQQWISSNHSTTSDKSGTSTDSAKYRSLLSQGDTNDAGIMFGAADISKTSDSTDSVIPATKLSYDSVSTPNETPTKIDLSSGSVAATPDSGVVKVTSLVQSFDKAWVHDISQPNNSLLQLPGNGEDVDIEEDAAPNGVQPVEETPESRATDADSDDEEVYVEGENKDDAVDSEEGSNVNNAKVNGMVGKGSDAQGQNNARGGSVEVDATMPSKGTEVDLRGENTGQSDEQRRRSLSDVSYSDTMASF